MFLGVVRLGWVCQVPDAQPCQGNNGLNSRVAQGSANMFFSQLKAMLDLAEYFD